MKLDMKLNISINLVDDGRVHSIIIVRDNNGITKYIDGKKIKTPLWERVVSFFIQDIYTDTVWLKLSKDDSRRYPIAFTEDEVVKFYNGDKP